MLKQEYKQLKMSLEEKAREHYNRHMQAFEEWKEGGIKKIWIDDDGNICIEYESGKWWHYNDDMEWW